MRAPFLILKVVCGLNMCLLVEDPGFVSSFFGGCGRVRNRLADCKCLVLNSKKIRQKVNYCALEVYIVLDTKGKHVSAVYSL